MPSSTPHLCPRCRTIVRGPCPTCSVGWNARKPASWDGAKRSDRRWRKLRIVYLRAHPFCMWPGCSALADRVDHIDGTDYDTQRYDWQQLRALCTHHHNQRTTAQGNAAQGRGV